MFSQSFLATVAIISGVAVLAWAIWTIYVGMKYKVNENEDVKLAITKANSVSAYLLWFTFIAWEGVFQFVDKNTMLTVSQLKIFVIFLLGIQCLVQVLAGIYYLSELKKNSRTALE